MPSDNEFQIRPGRIRSKSAQRVRPFIAQALAAAQKAGATVRRGRISSGRSTFGRGRTASHAANRLLTNRSRLVVVKARVVRHSGRASPLAAHLRYLRREGVTQDGDKAVLFGPDRDAVDSKEFADRCADDRHHFRFIVSPEDAPEMSDLTHFTRDLMKQAQMDLGTGLDWVAVSHWNTEHPHIHVIVRGVTDTGEDLVISRDYIKEGLRAQAQLLVTAELGLRQDAEIQRALHRQVDAERYTQLDRQLLSDARRLGYVDLAPSTASAPDEFQALKAGRVRKLEALGLADQFAPGQWVLSERTEPVLRELGERNDIIKRIHRSLSESQLDRATSSFALGKDMPASPITGRLLARGLDDELKGTAYVVIDGADGRTHNVPLPSLEASGDAPVNAIVTVTSSPSPENRRAILRVESDLALEAQVTANGATWLDRQLLKGDHTARAATGFGADVDAALVCRTDHLVSTGLALRTPEGVELSPGLLQRLTRLELDTVSTGLKNAGAKSVRVPAEGEQVGGVYRRRLDLASGRFAVLDDGMGFQLVPWSPKIDRHLGEPISGLMRSRTAVTWEIGRSKSLGIDM
jgi:type IV secretory pathway VirD2 relaxase